MPTLPTGRSATSARNVFRAKLQHELRTPATAIVGYAQMLLADGSEATADGADLYLILEEGRGIVRLIDDLLYRRAEFVTHPDETPEAFARRSHDLLSRPLTRLMDAAEHSLASRADGDRGDEADLNRILRAGRRLRSAVDELSAALAAPGALLAADSVVSDAVSSQRRTHRAS